MRLAGLSVGGLALVLLALPGGTAEATRAGDIASLEPGVTYIASFSLGERQDACRFLDIAENTSAFENCLQGNFPENPWFSR